MIVNPESTKMFVGPIPLIKLGEDSRKGWMKKGQKVYMREGRELEEMAEKRKREEIRKEMGREGKR